MTTFPARISEKENPAKLINALELVSVGKKYALQAGQINKKAVSEDFWALKDVSLNVLPGKILGVVGRNGAGKTTLLNIISGVFPPTEGKVISLGRVLGLFNLGVGFQDEFTGRENIFLNGAVLGASRKELSAELNEIIEFSELGAFIDMPLGTYSQGMRLRLGFSIIANLDFDILVMDEVLTVGDALFQSKCFQRLMDFKRSGRTLIITTQSLDLIERLCDKAVLMDHGRLLFEGSAIETINKYSALLNTDKFFVGSVKKNTDLVENTKKWADDLSEWGKEFGTKEVLIESVEFINKWGLKCEKVKSGEPLKIKARFSIKNRVKEPHFGVAIFRKDGVYCYGPNTAFDGHAIPELKPGRGYFILDCHKLLLAPGEYRISVAVWDKNETLAYGYQAGFHKLTVAGSGGKENELLNMPFKFHPGDYLNFKRRNGCNPDLSALNDSWGQTIKTEQVKLESIKLLNHSGAEKSIFMSNEFVSFVFSFGKLPTINPGIIKVSLRTKRSNLFNKIASSLPLLAMTQSYKFIRSYISAKLYSDKNYHLWLGIYRDDGIYCQGIARQLDNEDKNFEVVFPKFPLLPGGYKIYCGVWDKTLKKFLVFSKDAIFFRMVFDKKDHGTVYLKHSWAWSLP